MLQLKTAKEFMISKLITLRPENHVHDGIDKLLKHNISGAPVVDSNGEFLGVFSEKCCMSVLNTSARNAWNDSNGVASSVKARDFMVSQLTTLSPKTDVLMAIDLLLQNRISGAPVLDDQGTFLGVFSEKSCMSFLISSAYDQLPTTRVEALMNRDQGRIISADMDLFDVAQIFLDTPYRRLPVIENGKLVGQISRRDVLRTEKAFSDSVRGRITIPASRLDPIDEATQHSGDTKPFSVARFMDRDAKSIRESTDILGVARLFLDTPYRRLPVVENKKLVGQISRRDLIQAASKLFDLDPPPREKSLLYLSSLVARKDATVG